MSATFASQPWPVLPAVRPAPLGHRISAEEGGGVRWLLKPNCSLSPRQLGAVYLSLCVLCLMIGTLFAWQGAPWVAAFAGLELVLLGVALLVFARHAGDRETLTMRGRVLHVQRARGAHIDEHELPLAWLAVEPRAGQGSLVQLRGRGQVVAVGRWLRPHQRGQLARELRQAQAEALHGSQPNTN